MLSSKVEEQRIIQYSYLTKRLSDLLGFGDNGGIEDILDHLLTIASNRDLFDYLTQLLGNSCSSSDHKKNIQQFVNEVGMYQRHEIITIPLSDDEGKSNDDDENNKNKNLKEKAVLTEEKTSSQQKQSKPPSVAASKQSTPKKTATNSSQQKQQQQQPETSKKKKPPVPAAVLSTKTNQKKNREGGGGDGNNEVSQNAAATTANNNTTTSSSSSIPSVPLETMKVAERIAKPDDVIGTRIGIVCGCFGNYHPPLVNCLHCGRISCEQEGYHDYCPFCHYYIQPMSEPAVTDEKAIVNAWNEKERLLQYDREKAQRTIIIDDQEDYYPSMNANSIWLSDDERQEAIDREQRRYDEIHARNSKMTFNLSLE